jgi:DNA primase
MVEGYTDVISMHQCGIENVVANSGTALSVYQIRMLRRFTRNITFIYDGDAAGIHAALRGTDIALREGMNLKMLLLPDGDDPDSFARNHSSEEVKEYIKTHQTDFIEFKMNLMLKGVTDPIKRSEAINSIVQSISVITDQIIRATYIHDCAQRLGIREETLISQMNRFIRSGKDEMEKDAARAESVQQKAPVQGGEQQVKGNGLEKKVEKMLIRMVVLYGERMITVQDNEGNDIELPLAQYVAMDLGADNLRFTNEIYNRILEECVAHLDDEDFKAET